MMSRRHLQFYNLQLTIFIIFPGLEAEKTGKQHVSSRFDFTRLAECVTSQSDSSQQEAPKLSQSENKDAIITSHVTAYLSLR